MATRVNFHHCAPEHNSWRHHTQALLKAVTPLTVLMIALLLLPPTKSFDTPLEKLSNTQFFRDLRFRCLTLDSPHDVRELKDNFLTNARLKDPLLRQTFQSSGLSHLLALSGSQTGPVSSLVCLFVVTLCIAGLSLIRPLTRYSIVVCIRACGLISELVALVCLVGLFQSTGALNKILSSKVASLVIHPLRSSAGETQLNSALLDPKVTLTLPWLFALILGKNPVHDLSFLLSTLGAHTVQIVAILVSTAWSGSGKNTQVEQSFVSKICLKAATQLAQWTLITSLTSTAMCLFCFQLWPVNNLWDKILANLLAGPLVLFLITPAALLVIMSVALNFHAVLVLANSTLDTSLAALLLIGEAFSEDTGVGARATTPFLHPGTTVAWHLHPYLCLHLLILLLAGIQTYTQQFRALRNY